MRQVATPRLQVHGSCIGTEVPRTICISFLFSTGIATGDVLMFQQTLLASVSVRNFLLKRKGGKWSLQEDTTHLRFNPRSPLANLKVNIRQRGNAFLFCFNLNSHSCSNWIKKQEFQTKWWAKIKPGDIRFTRLCGRTAEYTLKEKERRGRLP